MSMQATVRLATLKHAQDALKGVVRISILSEAVLLMFFCFVSGDNLLSPVLMPVLMMVLSRK